MARPYVPIERMRDRLLTVDDLRERLSTTEPLESKVFNTRAAPFVRYSPDWFKRMPTDPAPVWLTIPGGERVQLTYQAAQELGSTCHINQGYQEMVPPDLLEEHVNWWLSTGLGERDLKLLCAGLGHEKDDESKEVPLAVAMCRATVTPFSNIRLLDSVLDGIEKKYGEGARAEALVDYKLWHDLEQSMFRVIVPGANRVIEGTSEEDDTWSLGIQVKNSPIGLKQTFIDGYLFRWWCTNGEIDKVHSSGGFKRRGSDEEEVYSWAREAVDEVLGGVEGHSFDAVQSLVNQPVEHEVVTVLRDLFGQAHLPKREQNRVIEAMADQGGNLTMYDLVNAVTQTANQDGLPWRAVEQLMEMGGRIIHTAGSRCGNCRRMLPPDWVPPEDYQPVDQHGHDHPELN